MALGSDSSTADPTFRLSIRPRADLSDYEAWQVRNWQAQTFDLSEEFATVDWYVFGMRDGQWVSMLEITERTALVDQQPIALALVGSVMTSPHWRGHGYARAVLEHATTFFCQQRSVTFGLLLCMDGLVSFYARQGWHQVTEPLFYDQPTGKVQSDQNTMIYTCQAQAWPSGTIDLCGLPV
jgi:GNAT superfamily N-acetyltransferase